MTFNCSQGEVAGYFLPGFLDSRKNQLHLSIHPLFVTFCLFYDLYYLIRTEECRQTFDFKRKVSVVNHLSTISGLTK
jgi:hypothetical protein